MDIRELRIGNWVNIGYYHEWSWFDYENYIKGNEYVDYFDNDAVEPIPIIHEFLIKSGFDFDQITYDNGYGIWLAPREGDYNVFLGSLSKPIPVVVKYVHEFQNLYFSLTGSELDITVL